MPRKKLSIICPAYNEENNLSRLYERVTRLFEESLSGYDYEVLILDNCSEDQTRERSLDICRKEKR